MRSYELFDGKKNALKHFMIKFYENDCTIWIIRWTTRKKIIKSFDFPHKNKGIVSWTNEENTNYQWRLKAIVSGF